MAGQVDLTEETRVGRLEFGEGISVATQARASRLLIGEEPQRDHTEGGRRGNQNAVLHHGNLGPGCVGGDQADDAVAWRLAQIGLERHPADLREAALRLAGSARGDAPFQQLQKLGSVHGDHAEPVVESQGVFDVELRNLAGDFARIGIGGRRQGPTVGGEGANRVADAAAIFQGDADRRVAGDLTGGEEVGVGGEVAEVRFLRADDRPPSLEEDRRQPELNGIFSSDDLIDQVGHLLDRGPLRAEGERVQSGPQSVPDVDHALRVGRVGAAHGRVNRFRLENARRVEPDDHPAHVAVSTIGADDCNRVSVGIRKRDGVRLLGQISRAEPVAGVSRNRVRAAREDNVHATEQRRKDHVVRELLQLGHQDHFVDARRLQEVDCAVDDGGHTDEIEGIAGRKHDIRTRR